MIICQVIGHVWATKKEETLSVYLEAVKWALLEE